MRKNEKIEFVVLIYAFVVLFSFVSGFCSIIDTIAKASDQLSWNECLEKWKVSSRQYPGTMLWPVSGVEPNTNVGCSPGFRDAISIQQRQGGSLPSWAHHGTDISGVTESTAIRAAAPGKAYASYENGGLGYYVVISHGDGWYTEYQHLSAFGERIVQGKVIDINAGETIGYAGNTPGGYPVHLHFEIAYDPSGSEDPKTYISNTSPASQYYNIIRSNGSQCTISISWPEIWELCDPRNQNFVKNESEMKPRWSGNEDCKKSYFQSGRFRVV